MNRDLLKSSILHAESSTTLSPSTQAVTWELTLMLIHLTSLPTDMIPSLHAWVLSRIESLTFPASVRVKGGRGAVCFTLRHSNTTEVCGWWSQFPGLIKQGPVLRPGQLSVFHFLFMLSLDDSTAPLTISMFRTSYKIPRE